MCPPATPTPTPRRAPVSLKGPADNEKFNYIFDNDLDQLWTSALMKLSLT
jgi:hypothetical protein